MAADQGRIDVGSHKVEAQYPHAKRMVMACKNGTREIVKLSFTGAAMVTLSIFLRLVKTSLGNAIRAAGNAADSVGPSHPPNLCKAFLIVHQKQKRKSHPWQPIVVQVTNTPKP